MSLLPIHRKHLSRPVNFRATTRRTILHCVLTCRIPSTPTWQSLSLGSGLWPSTPIRLHSGKTKERISQRSTHHLLCGLPISTHAQHPCQAHLSAHSSRLSQPLCHRGRLHIPFHSAISACRRRFNPGQSRFSGLLHQH